MPKGGGTYSRASTSRSGHVGRSGKSSDKSGGGGSVKGRLSRGGTVAASNNTGRGSSSRSRIPSKGSYAGAGGTSLTGSSVSRAHGHSALQAKTRATGQRKGTVKTVRPGRSVPGPI